MPTPLPRPAPTDYQDAPGTELDLVWDELCDVVEATEATANAALPATQSAAGTLISAAADKATPVDADNMALSDSAAGGVLRRFSWASLKAALNGIFARLAGVSGGQTLIGGTQANDSLTLQGSSAASGNTGTSKAVRILVSDSGATEAVSVQHDGRINLLNTTAPGTALTYRAFISANPSVADDNSINYCGLGSVLELNYTASCTKTRYGLLGVVRNQPGTTANYTSASMRGVQGWAYHYGTGTISSVYGLIGGATAVAGSGAVTTTVSGLLGSVTLATASAVPLSCGLEGAVYKTGSATVTTAVGVNCEIGNSNAGGSITNACGIAVGHALCYPWSNTGTITNCHAIHIGASTNIGTNRKAIHSESPAASYLAGSLSIGIDASSAKLHSMATTEQLRLGYDASNYVSFTVDSNARLKIAAPLTIRPPSSITPAANGDMTFELSSNTTLTIKAKGSDGVVRSAAITLA